MCNAYGYPQKIALYDRALVLLKKLLFYRADCTPKE
jgi:hypothetical protein